jgi:hypothetical protein
MESNKTAGSDRLPAKIWKMFCIMKGGKRNCNNWILAITYPVHKANGKRVDPGNYREMFAFIGLR